MLDIVKLSKFVSQTRRSGSSGYESDEEFNINLAAVDVEVYRTLIPYYAKDDRIQKLFSPFIETEQLPIVNGRLAVPDNFEKYIDTVFDGGSKIVYPRNLNERAVIKSSSIQNPSVESEEYFCFFDKNEIIYLPQEVTSGELVYLRKSVPGEIKYNYVETEDSDYYTVEKVKDIEWDNELFGLFSALMLEKFGFQNRETVALEYANLGVQREIVNTDR